MGAAVAALAGVGLLSAVAWQLLDDPKSEAPLAVAEKVNTPEPVVAEAPSEPAPLTVAEPSGDVAVAALLPAPTPAQDEPQDAVTVEPSGAVEASTLEHAAVEPSIGAADTAEPEETVDPADSAELAEQPAEAEGELETQNAPEPLEVDVAAVAPAEESVAEPTAPAAILVEPPEIDLDASELALWTFDDEPYAEPLTEVALSETAAEEPGELVVAALAEPSVRPDAVVDGAFADAEPLPSETSPQLETVAAATLESDEALVSLAADLPPHALPTASGEAAEEPEPTTAALSNGHATEPSDPEQGDHTLASTNGSAAAADQTQAVSVEPVRLSELLPSIVETNGAEPLSSPVIEVIEPEAAPAAMEPPSILAEPPPPYDPIPAEPLPSDEPVRIASTTPTPAITPLPVRRPETRQLAVLPPATRRNGTAKWQQFSAPAAGPERGPMIALVIDDLGLNRPKTWRTIELPAPLTLSFLTYAQGLPEMTAAARQRGHELMLHVPMQPIDPRENPGRNPLVTEETRERLSDRLIWGLGRFDGYVGINNHMGSRFTAWPEGMAVVMSEMRRRGLLFLDSLTTYQSVGSKVAERFGVPYAVRDVFLDNNAEDAGAIRRQLDKLEETALERGYAVGIGHPYPETLNVLSAWLPKVWGRGLRLVPISAVVRHRIELAARDK